jgi:hypothetical protein
MTLARLIAGGESLVSNLTRPSVGVRAELESLDDKTVLVLRVPKATVPTATSTGRYLRRTLGGDGKPACVPFFVFETVGGGLASDPSAAVVPGATWNDLDPLEIEGRPVRLAWPTRTRWEAPKMSMVWCSKTRGATGSTGCIGRSGGGLAC